MSWRGFLGESRSNLPLTRFVEPTDSWEILASQFRIGDLAFGRFKTPTLPGLPCLKRLVGAEDSDFRVPGPEQRARGGNCSSLISEVLTVYKFFYSDSNGRLKNGPISMRKLVSAVGIEPTTY
jgi:hypothetical protein